MKRNAHKIAIWIKSNDRAFKILGLAFFALTGVVGVIWLFGRDVEPVAFTLGVVSSSMFGLTEVARYIEPDRKAVRDMSLDELIALVERTEPKENWTTVETDWVAESVLREDPRLRASIRYDEAGTQNEDFREPWANSFPDPKATSYWVDLSYDRSLLERFILVSVDGGRALLPIPRSQNNLVVSKKNYVVAQLFDSSMTLAEYLSAANIEVVEA